MKKIFSFAIAAALLAAAGPASAETLLATITSIDTAGRLLMLQPVDRPDQNLTVSVRENAAFSGARTLNELSAGNKVRVDVREKDGALEAGSVTLISADAGRAAPALATAPSSGVDARGTALTDVAAIDAAARGGTAPSTTLTPPAGGAAPLTSTPNVTTLSPALRSTPGVTTNAAPAPSSIPGGSTTTVTNGRATPVTASGDMTPFMGGTGSTGRAVDTGAGTAASTSSSGSASTT
jgi:hypothetical protein